MSLELKYWVLKPKSKSVDDHFAMASRESMRLFAELIDPYDQELAESLIEWADCEEENMRELYRLKENQAK